MENKIIIDRDEYDKLILTAYAFDFLTDSLLMNAKIYINSEHLYFSDEKTSDVLKIMCPKAYDARLAELKGALE